MHAIVRTDLMYATDVRAGLVSVRYQPADTKTAIDNGNVVLLTSLETGSREVYKGVTPAANSSLKDVVLVASPEVMYDERLRNLGDFYNVEGKIARGYHLHTNDVFSVSKEALDGVAEPAVGNVVELKAGTKLNVATSLTSGSTKVGEVIDVNVVNGVKLYAIKVA